MRHERANSVTVGLDLNGETVRQAGWDEPPCVEPDRSVRDVLQCMRERRRGALLVCRDGVLTGIFTERDALRFLADGGDLTLPVEKFMTPNPLALGPQDTIATALVRMSSRGYRRLPIIDSSGRAIGIIDIAWLVHWLAEHYPKVVYNLPPVPKPVIPEREGP